MGFTLETRHDMVHYIVLSRCDFLTCDIVGNFSSNGFGLTRLFRDCVRTHWYVSGSYKSHL